MRESMVTLFDEIGRCVGEVSCWGGKNPKFRRPVVLPCKQKPDVMIVTEQMNVRKEWRKNPEVIPAAWDPSIELLSVIKEVKEDKRRKDSGIIPKIDELFNGRFLEDFDTENMSFRKFYWTHFIKCPGNLRNSNFGRNAPKLNICADKLLLKEIKVLNPQVIVSMGGHASTWILRKTGYPHEWIDMLWEEAERVIIKEYLIPERGIVECGCKAKIIV
ncbi:MAG: hypothetical protein QXR19_18320, partial [Candidatus Jordarchaeaceae archaeon]